jgi:hypothetical protein
MRTAMPSRVGLGLGLGALLALTPAPRAQIQAVNPQIRHASGQLVSPVFEGWFHAPDKSVHALFGYFNRNAEQVVRAPVGPDNKVDPGAIDQGQPTVFFPGRQYGVFTVAQPAGQRNVEMVWSLTVAGRTMAIPANVGNQEFLIEPFKEMGGSFPGNTPPELKLDAAGPVLKGPMGGSATRTAAVGTPLPLEVWVTDDGLPPPLGPVKPGGPPRRALTVTWSEFRGPGAVSFAQESPSIEGGRAMTTATFKEPGDYVVRAVVSDGSGFSAQCCWTNGYVRVAVGAGPGR